MLVSKSLKSLINSIFIYLFFSHITYIPLLYDGQTVLLMSDLSRNYVTILKSFKNYFKLKRQKFYESQGSDKII